MNFKSKQIIRLVLSAYLRGEDEKHKADIILIARAKAGQPEYTG